MVAEHPNDLVRDSYVMQVADKCQLAPDMLRERLQQRAWRQDATAKPKTARARASVPELDALRLAIHHPEAVADKLEEALFQDELHVAAFRALATSMTLQEAVEAGGPEVGGLLQRLAVEDTDDDPESVIAILALGAAQRAISRLESEIRASGAVGPSQKTIEWLKLRINEWPAPDATRQLVAWLARSAQEGE
jgi:hypothetical protein